MEYVNGNYNYFASISCENDLVAKKVTLENAPAKEFAECDIKKLEELVKSSGFYHNKAKNIKNACKLIVEKFNGEVPEDYDDLLSLAGVGRKTANLLLGDLYNVPGSTVCDTHCIRICGRLGLSEGKDPEKVERQLRLIRPPEESNDFCHRIVLFGREVCIARAPKCNECPLRPWCKEFQP